MHNNKEQFIRSIQMRLALIVDADKAAEILGVIAYELRDYNMEKATTEIVPYDDDNDKIIKAYMACLIVEGKSKGTVLQYQRTAKRLFEFLGNKKFDTVTTLDIRSWLASLKLSGCKNVTINNQQNNVSAFFTWLFNEEMITKNPCSTIKQVKVPEEEKKAFTSDEVDTVRSNCDGLYERALVETLLSSGLRVAELCSLKTADIDFAKLTVYVKNGKGGKDRTTFITPVARKYLLSYIDNNKHKSDYVFTTKYGSKYTPYGIRKTTEKLSKKCGFRVHPHRFRRTLATDLARKGMPIQEIQRLLGHSSISVTRKYIETRIEQVEASYRQYVA